MNGKTGALDGPDLPWLEQRYTLGKSLSQSGHFAQAVAILGEVLENDPDSPKHYDTLILALRKERNDKDAVALAQRAVDRFPGHAGLWNQLALALGDANLFEAADAADLTAHRVDIRTLAARTDLIYFDGVFSREGKAALIRTAEAGKLTSQWSVCRALGRLTAENLVASAEQLHRGEPVMAGQVWPFGVRSPNIDVPPVAPVTTQARRPVLSVMVPAYNPDPEWLRICLHSVLAQDQGPAWAEIVVVDDSSSDTAKDVAESFGNRVRYHRNDENLGLLRNHNQCIALSRGHFVHILHQDDAVEPGFYQAVLDPLCSDPALVGAFTGVNLDGSDGSRIVEALEQRNACPARDLYLRLLRRQRVQFASIVMRRRAFEALGGFTPSRVFAFDWEMWARLAKDGTLWYDPRPLAITRLHAQSATHSISVLDRLVDVLQTQYGILQHIEGDSRRAAAGRFAFSYQCAEAWQKLFQQLAVPDGSDVGDLRDFLTSLIPG